jgi:hypothetical protein
MTDRSKVDIETHLGSAVRNYLLHEPNERISEDENLREVCRWLTGFLDRQLGGEGGWGRYKSVDAIEPCTVKRASTKRLEFAGLAAISHTDRFFGERWVLAGAPSR